MIDAFWVEFIQGVLVFIMTVASNTASVEALKKVISLLITRFPSLSDFRLKDRGSFVVAAMVAFVFSHFIGQDIVALLGLDGYLSPEISQFMTWCLVFLGSNGFYDRFIRPYQVEHMG